MSEFVKWLLLYKQDEKKIPTMKHSPLSVEVTEIIDELDGDEVTLRNQVPKLLSVWLRKFDLFFYSSFMK